MAEIIIDLLRHGECDGGERFRGRIDLPLCDEGWRSMHEGLVQLSGNWQQIVSSPLVRCASFAERLAATLKAPLLLEPRLQEIDFGEWDGLLYEDVWRTQAEQVQAWYADPVNCPPPGGEGYADFSGRVLATLDDLAQHYSGQRLLLVTHGGVIRCLLAQALGFTPGDCSRFRIAYGTALTLKLEQKKLSLVWPASRVLLHE